MGNTVKKKIKAITIGEIIEPSNIPNLNQSLFNDDNDFGTTRARKRNIPDIIKAQILMLLLLISGYREIIKKNIENTTPKDLGEEWSISLKFVETDTLIKTLIVNFRNTRL